MVDVRPATPADVSTVSRALARAFDDDPIFQYLFTGMSDREGRAERFFRVLFPLHLGHDTLLVPRDEVVGASLRKMMPADAPIPPLAGNRPSRRTIADS